MTKKWETHWNTTDTVPKPEDPNHLKILVLGASAIGKTCLCHTLTTGTFPSEYVPTISDNATAKIVGTDKTAYVSLWDTVGRGDYFLLRRQSYPGTKVILLCYSAINQATFEVLATEYKEELSYMPGVPVILVGLKADLRNDKDTLERLQDRNEKVISIKQGEDLANAFGFVCHMECSALYNKGVQEVFSKAIEVAMDPPKKQPVHQDGKCILM